VLRYEIRGLRKSFGSQVVLDGLDLDIVAGQFLTIIGESGCGKSVLLKAIIGVQPADAGSIRFDGADVALGDEAAFQQIRRRVGMLFQNSALFDSMSVFDNVAYGLREQRLLPEAEIPERVSESLGFVQLPGIEQMAPGELSGGMRKRVALARAIAMRPETVLYDEPTEGLDPINVTRVYRLLEALRKQLGITTVVVTHNMETAFKYSERIVFIDGGRITHEGTPDELRRDKDPKLAPFLESAHSALAEAREG
jgi:phospholipid/cholesterol/gamma-HCH transport system ATP-binding protein